MSEEEEEERDWSELPLELLHLIAKKLPFLPDFIYFRAVCTTWRSSAPLSDPPQQFPWLLKLFERDYSCSTLRRKQRFYSVSSRKTLTIPLTNKKLKLRSWIKGGVSCRYLSFHDHNEGLTFFNPLTRDRFTVLPMRFSMDDPRMVWTGTDPIRNRCIVVVDRVLDIGNEMKSRWAFYDPQCNKWVKKYGYFHSSCYWQGMFFSTTCTNGHTKVFNAYREELLHTIPPPEIEMLENWHRRDSLAHNLRKSYLVMSSGFILRVLWFHDLQKKTIKESLFHIYKLDFERADGKPCWVRIGDIGDQILFLDELNGFSVTATPSTGFKQGCIYFIDPKESKPYMHDVLTGKVERVRCPFKRCTWFLPGL